MRQHKKAASLALALPTAALTWAALLAGCPRGADNAAATARDKESGGLAGAVGTAQAAPESVAASGGALGFRHASGPWALKLAQIVLPPGFSIDLYAEADNAREMALSPSGILYLGSNGAQKVYACVDQDGDGYAETVLTLAEKQRLPVGVAWHDGDLYFSAVSSIWRIDGADALVQAQLAGGRADRGALPAAAQPQLVTDALPTDEHHGWKFIRVGPDSLLYVPVGAPCNVCEGRPPYAGLLRMNLDGSAATLIGQGIRNTVGFDWHPATGELWFTDNGRDNIGGADQSLTDNSPPCELNRLPAGSATGDGAPHFGFPYWHGTSVKDPEFSSKLPQEHYSKPVQDLGAHVAPLGLRFYTGSMFPAEYRGQPFIAEHGSWNRSKKQGYRISLVRLDANGASLGYETFAEGWLRAGDQVWGRPADVCVMPDGSLLVSDDYAGAVYRISYIKP